MRRSCFRPLRGLLYNFFSQAVSSLPQIQTKGRCYSMNGSPRDLSAKLHSIVPFVLLSAALILLVAAVTSIPPAHAQTAHPAAVAAGDKHAGEELFQHRCMLCHSTTEGQKVLGPSLYHELAKPHPKQTDAAVRLIIKNGKTAKTAGDPSMPAWGAGAPLSDTDINNIIAYLHTI